MKSGGGLRCAPPTHEPRGTIRGTKLPTLIVTSDPQDWPHRLPDTETIDAWSYLTRPRFNSLRNTRVINLCHSHEFQGTGYYVSLLAEARGHRPLPSVTTIQDLQTQAIVRLIGEELSDLIQKTFAGLPTDQFDLEIYFGRTVDSRFGHLSLELFNIFQAPLLRAHFLRDHHGRWHLRRVETLCAEEIPRDRSVFIGEVAREYLSHRRLPKQIRAHYSLAILHNPQEIDPPSNAKAMPKFLEAAEALGLHAELIQKEDYGRLSEFDALFIRETTAVDHHTYRFARRAAGEGLVVVDDPRSILRCTNKVYLAELLERHQIPRPKTLVVHRGNAHEVAATLGFPVVLKRPDSAFSLGVVKAETPAELDEQLERLFQFSELIVAQEFIASEFDWRIGILDRKPLFVCKYYMFPEHWQIIKRDQNGKGHCGKLEAVPLDQAPPELLRIALKAANLIGDGLYGVDMKQTGNRFHLIEVNDNPNLDFGNEDAVLGDDLYRTLMRVFLSRIEQRKPAVLAAS